MPWRARTVPPTALRRRTGRPQLKRDPLGTYGHTMRNTTRGSVLPALACAVSLLASRAAPAQTAANATVSKTDLEHVLTAIKDEIYALGSYPQYLDLANGMQNIPLYVEPHREHGYIWMIYKLMPCGEVQRAGWEAPGGDLVLLAGNAKGCEFYPTHETALLTVYLDDRDLIRKKTTWTKVSFSLHLRPSPQELRGANQRQAQRDKLQGRSSVDTSS